MNMNHRVYSFLLTLGIVILIFLIRWLLVRFVIQHFKSQRTRYNWRKAITYISYIIVFIAIAAIWLEEFQSAATFLGLLSAGLAVALKDPILDFFGWLFIIFARPFEMGDRIEIGNKAGDVLDIQFFKFTMLEIGAWVDANQSTGRIIHMPNGQVFTQPITNFVQGFQQIWHEIPILITFDSDWEKAKQLLLEIEQQRVKPLAETAKKQLNQSEERYNIHYSKLEPTVYTSVKEHGILLTLRFLCAPRSQRNSEQEIWEEVLRIFKQHDDIQFAYPSQNVYLKNSPS